MGNSPQQTENLGQYQSLFEAALEGAARDEFVSRIWQADASLWKTDAAHQKIMSNSLGWLTAPRFSLERIDEI